MYRKSNRKIDEQFRYVGATDDFFSKSDVIRNHEVMQSRKFKLVKLNNVWKITEITTGDLKKAR